MASARCITLGVPTKSSHHFTPFPWGKLLPTEPGARAAWCTAIVLSALWSRIISLQHNCALSGDAHATAPGSRTRSHPPRVPVGLGLGHRSRAFRSLASTGGQCLANGTRVCYGPVALWHAALSNASSYMQARTDNQTGSGFWPPAYCLRSLDLFFSPICEMRWGLISIIKHFDNSQ